MRIAMLTDSKKALMFAGAIVFGVIMTVDSNSGETAFDSTDPDYEYSPPPSAAATDSRQPVFGQSEPVEREDRQDRDYDDSDTSGFDPTPEDIRPTNPLFDEEPRAGSRNAANRPPGIDGPNT